MTNIGLQIMAPTIVFKPKDLDNTFAPLFVSLLVMLALYHASLWAYTIRKASVELVSDYCRGHLPCELGNTDQSASVAASCSRGFLLT
jgi:hypothetical protein